VWILSSARPSAVPALTAQLTLYQDYQTSQRGNLSLLFVCLLTCGRLVLQGEKSRAPPVVS
jgi:hypothetical protein